MTPDIQNQMDALATKIVLGEHGSVEDLYVPEKLKDRYDKSLFYTMVLANDNDIDVIKIADAAKRNLSIKQKKNLKTVNN